MKLRAIQAGYDNLKRRAVGEVFEWPDTTPMPSWAQSVDLPYTRDDAQQAADQIAKRDLMTDRLSVTTSEPQTFQDAQTRGRGRPRGG